MNSFWIRRGTRYKNYNHLMQDLNEAIKHHQLTNEMANNIMDFAINDYQIRFKFNNAEEEKLFNIIIFPRFVRFKKVWFE
jgi:hypothetical protein